MDVDGNDDDDDKRKNIKRGVVAGRKLFPEGRGLRDWKREL